MKAVTKEHYIQFWNQVNSDNLETINTPQIVQWISLLEGVEEQFKKNQSQDKNKQNTKNKASKSKKSKKGQTNQEQKLIYPPLSQDEIGIMLKKYCESEPYKELTKNKQGQEKSQKSNSNGSTKNKLKPQRKVSKLKTKKVQQEQQMNPNNLLINIIDVRFSYEQCIGFYYWFTQNKNLIQEERQFKTQNSLQESGELNASIQETKKYRPSKGVLRYFNQLTQKQKQKVFQDYLNIIKRYQANLLIIFKHYSKIDHLTFQKKFQSFQEMKQKVDILNLHQFMLFTKNWNILSTKKNSTSTSKSELLIIFQKYAYQRKQMNFQQFLQALVQISCKVFQNCDLQYSKPIDMLLNSLNIKQQQIFIKRLQENNIKSKQSDFINCFKNLDKQIFGKLSLVKHYNYSKNQLNEEKRRYTELQNLKYRIQASKSASNHKFQPLLSHQSQLFQANKQLNQTQNVQNNKSKTYFSQMLGRANSMPRISSQKMNTLLPNTATQNKTLFSKNKNNRKSAPQIGVNLPKIQNNRFFQPIQHNNHKNTYKGFLSNVPQSSSVFKNKITGYSKIHNLQLKEVNEQLLDHQTLSGVIDKKKSKIQQSKNMISQANEFIIDESQKQSKITRSKRTLNLVKEVSIKVETSKSSNIFQNPSTQMQKIKSNINKIQANPEQEKQSKNQSKIESSTNRNINYEEINLITHQEDNNSLNYSHSQELSSVYKDIANEKDLMLQKNMKENQENTTQLQKVVQNKLNLMVKT